MNYLQPPPRAVFASRERRVPFRCEAAPENQEDGEMGRGDGVGLVGSGVGGERVVEGMVGQLVLGSLLPSRWPSYGRERSCSE